MNKHLFFLSAKKNRDFVIGIILLFMMYSSIAAWMFDPDSAAAINDFLGVLPEAFIRALGFEGLGTDLTTYLANYLYGFIYIMFPMIYILLVVSRLIGKLIDEGSMVYLVASPMKRSTIAITQIGFFVISLFVIFAVNFTVIYGIAEFRFPGLLDVIGFFRLNVITYMVMILLSSIVFFLTVLPIDYAKAMTLSVGLSVYSFAANALYRLSDALSFVQYTTIFRLVDIDRSLQDPTWTLWTFVGLFVVSAVIFTSTVVLFEKRPLHI